MSFVKSILFGSRGSYNILGTQVKFENALASQTMPSLYGAGVISQLASKFISSNGFRLITQGYAHVFIHEMGHAIAHKLMTGQNSEVTVFTSSCTGRTRYHLLAVISLPDWKRTILNIAGPMADIAFSTCKLVAATALKSYLTWPVSLVLGAGAVIWISGELLYAYVSASKEDNGDFGCISSYSETHLVLASIVLVSQCALGIFAAIKLRS